MVAARYLQRGVDTAVCYLDSGTRSPSCAHQLAALKGCRVTLHPFVSTDDLRSLPTLFSKADVIVDALLGTGAAGTPKEPLATCVALANASRAKIVAADLPSPGMRADRICAFHRPKAGRVGGRGYRDPPRGGDLHRARRPDPDPGAEEDEPQGGRGRGARDRWRAVPGCTVPCRSRGAPGRCRYCQDCVAGL